MTTLLALLLAFVFCKALYNYAYLRGWTDGFGYCYNQRRLGVAV